MSTIEQQIEALEFEREGYVAFDKPDRVKDVDEQLAYWRGRLEKEGLGETAEALTPTQKKVAEASDGITTEAEAAAEDPAANGEAVSNELAAVHASETHAGVDTTITTEAEVIASEPAGAAEDASNELADRQASEKQPDGIDANVVTEAEIVAKTRTAEANSEPPTRPAKNATTDEWRTFAKHPAIALDVPTDAGRDAIVTAYIAKFAPHGNASKEAWVTYAKDHDVDHDGLTRDEIRAAALEAGWAAEPDATPPAEAGKRNTADSKPRTTR